MFWLFGILLFLLMVNIVKQCLASRSVLGEVMGFAVLSLFLICALAYTL